MNLYDFQKAGLERVRGNDNVAFYWDMGLGKTIVGTRQMLEFHRKLNLILCQKSKISDWAEYFSNCSIENYAVSPKDKEEDILPMLTVDRRKPIAIIVNYELAWRRSFLGEILWGCVMLDESSIIQNDNTKIAKFCLGLTYMNCILLSGTPCSGKYENLWTQAHMLGWDISRSVFDSTYVNWEKFYVGTTAHWRPYKDNPYKNVERLKAKLREHGADFLKTEEVLELPEQMIIPVSCEKSKEYEKFKKGRYISLDKYGNELIGDSIMAWRIGLRKLCTEFNDSKIAAVSDLLASTNERVVIFYNWNTELRILTTICSELDKPVSIVNGKEKDLSTYESESNSVTLVQYQAGAMGLNLQKAQRIIYFSLPERSDLFEQSKKRIHRIGQKSTCFYYIPIVKGTIETSIYGCLQQRKDYTDELFKEEMENGKADTGR